MHNPEVFSRPMIGEVRFRTLCEEHCGDCLFVELQGNFSFTLQCFSLQKLLFLIKMNGFSIQKINGGVWCPVFTLARNEKKVYSSLTKNGIPAYLPLKRHINIQPVMSKGKLYSYKRVLQIPMFTNYLFVNVTPAVQTELNWNRSVIRILKPSEQEEENLLKELQIIHELELFSEKEDIDVTNGLQKGTQVVFTQGSFAGWNGVVDSVEPEGMVYINILSVGASVRIKYPAVWCSVCG